MADDKTVSAVPQSKQSAGHPQPQTSIPAPKANSDARVKTAGASLGEFMAQLEDYTPTVMC